MSEARPQAWRRPLRWIFKAAVTLALGALLLRRMEWGALSEALLDFSWPLWAGGAVSLALGTALAAWRWGVVLRAMGEAPTLGSLTRDMLVAVAFNQLLPGAVGGDVARAWRCGRRLEVPARAWVSIFYERLVGLAVLVALPGVVLLWSPVAVPQGVYAAVCVVLLGALLGVGLAPQLARLAGRALPASWERVVGWMGEAARALEGPLGSARVRGEVVLWTVASQALMLGVCWALSLGWTWEQRALGVFVGVPLVTVLTLLPLGLGGLGWRESAFVVVLGWFGLQEERALALSLGWYALNLALGGVGLSVLGWEQRRGERFDSPGESVR